MNRKKLRSQIFRHLDGLVTAPVVVALNDKGVIQFLIEEEKVDLSLISKKFKANEGYLNVAFRILASQGFVEQKVINNDEISFKITKEGKKAFEYIHLYNDVVELLKFSAKFHPRKFEQPPFEMLNRIFEKYKNNYGVSLSADKTTQLVQKQILDHIEGHLVGPTIVRLGMNGMFHQYFMESSFSPEEFHEFPDSFKKILDFFVFLGWFDRINNNYQFTDVGLFFAQRATAYGVTVSYMPTFRNIDKLIFADPDSLKKINEDEDEIHVDREMNVWGSGGAHSNYFKVVDEIIIDLFNRPIDDQPKGVLDMGCGNGAFLIHIFNLIEKHTLRGSMLDEYPIFLVGVDYNKAALKVTRKNLIKAEIWAKVIWGDIGRPDLLADDLLENYNIDLKELLNVRTFLDHNRIWSEPNHIKKGRVSNSTGAFAYRGVRLSNNIIEDNLLEHMTKWVPYVKKFGLLVIELHSISPSLTSKNLGKTAATAYEATHGFSDQYIVEIEVFHKICSEAGLELDLNFFRKFPDSDLATISINLFR